MKTGVEVYFDEPSDTEVARTRDLRDRVIIVAIALGAAVVIGFLAVRHENSRPRESMKVTLADVPEPEIPTNVVQGFEFLEDNDLGAAEASFTREIEMRPSYLALVGRGIAAARSANYSLAESDFMAAAKLNPHSSAVQVNLAFTKLKTADYADAVQFYAKAIAIDPNLATAYGNRARCNFALGRYYDAVDDLSHVIRLDSNNAVGYVNRAVALGKLKRFESAVTNLLHPAIDESGTQQARKLAAVFQAKSRKALDSLKTCKLGMEIDPEDTELKLLSLNALNLLVKEQGESDSIARHSLAKAVSEFDLNPQTISDAKHRLEELENAFQVVGCCAPTLLLPSEGSSSSDPRSLDVARLLLEQADEFLRVGDLESAAVCLEQALWNDPSNADASTRLALTLIDQRRNDKAQALLDAMIARNPNSTILLEMKSMVDSQLGQFTTAIQTLNRLISLSKENKQAYLQRATVRYLEGRDYEAVIADCERVQRLGSTEANVLDLKGRAWTRLGKSTLALQDFTGAIGLMPKEPSHYIHRSSCLRGLGKIREAAADAMKATTLAPSSAEAHLELARCYFAANRFDHTVVEISKARMLSSNPETLSLLAKTLFILKKYDEAILAVNSIEDSRRTEDDQILLAKSHIELGELQSAWNAVLPFVYKQDATAATLILAGKIAFAERDYTQAVTFLEKAVMQDPTNSEAHLLLGKSAGGQSDWSKSIKHFRASLELNERNADAWLVTGNAFEQQQMNAKAVTCYSKAIEIDTQSGRARLARASVLVSMGDYETAILDLKWLSDRKSDLPEAERLLKLCNQKLVLSK